MATIKPPYYVIETDKGFLCWQGRYTTSTYITQEKWYKYNYNDKNEKWKRTTKTMFHYNGLVRRKHPETLDKYVDMIKSWKSYQTYFPNPRITYLDVTLKKYLERREAFIQSVNDKGIDYSIWSW